MPGSTKPEPTQPGPTQPGPTLTIDCGTCPAREVACEGCLVTALGGGPGTVVPDPAVDLPLDRSEREVLGRLVAAGLVTAETATRARAQHEPWSTWAALSAAG